MLEYKGDRVGQQVGPYRLTHLLGAGGFGEVYEADHQLLQQKRAIKLLLERHFHDPNQRERFLREARTLATLEHPNILPVLEVGEEGNVLYLVMPFYRRGTLNDLLKHRAVPLPLTEVERLLEQMCAAVGYAHARHIAHLDLKPDNMLLHEDGRLVLSDFGLAHIIKQGRLEAGSSASWGTPYYMAPEQIRGEPELRSDLYALGVVLYQLLTTQRPFTGNAPEAVMMKHLLETPPALHAVNPQAPAALEPVIQKALAKQPADRHPTAEALLTDFRAVVSGSSPRTTQPSAPNVPPAASIQDPNRPTPITPTTISIPPGHTPQTAQPANMAQTTGRGCEIPLNNGYNCGVTTIGRCTTCGRAFCLTHQARNWYYQGGAVPYVDMCAPCLAAKQDEQQRAFVAKVEKEKQQGRAQEYFKSGAAQAALLISGVQPVEMHSLDRQWEPKKGLFGGSGRYVDVVTFSWRGWILGELLWKYDRNSKGTEKSEEVVGDCLTALLDVSPNDLLNCGLARVQSCAGGYEILSLGRNDRFNSWIEAMQAVKRLIGESS